MSRATILLLLSSLLAASGCAGRTGAAARGGHLLLLGGGDKPPGFYARLVALAGGGAARIVVLPMASADSRATGEEYRRELVAAGAGSVEVVHVDGRDDAARPEHVAAVARASAVFFTGGDQSRIAERLVDTPLVAAIAALHRRGGVIAGTSAGAACQSDIMLVGEGDEHTVRAGTIVTRRGIGLFGGVIVDSHFLTRQRENRLLAVVLEHPDRIGVGIDERTAIWVKPDGTVEVLGDGGVLIWDARKARIVTRSDGQLGAAGVRAQLLVAGQRYDLFGGRLLP